MQYAQAKFNLHNMFLGLYFECDILHVFYHSQNSTFRFGRLMHKLSIPMSPPETFFLKGFSLSNSKSRIYLGTSKYLLNISCL